ncbi:MAG: hypothetical protein ACRD2L_14605 [Terriglobia bacterium]
MNTTFEAGSSKVDGRAGSTAVRVRTTRTVYFLVMAVALIACGCRSEHSTSSFADSNAYRHQLAVSDIQSFLYLEPSTQSQVPQVRGSLRNLGHQTLVMVELTLSFKNRRNQIIFEETAYPIYVSTVSHAQGSKPLAPGQQVKFAFKSPACPKDWQPGQVDVRVTKVVASGS